MVYYNCSYIMMAKPMKTLESDCIIQESNLFFSFKVYRIYKKYNFIVSKKTTFHLGAFRLLLLRPRRPVESTWELNDLHSILGNKISINSILSISL